MPRDLRAPAVVIAHGAWADATSWREVIAVLQAKGLKVVAVQNPLTALADDVDAVTRALNHQPNPVVLVGHDYGGTVITRTGQHQKVAALVYIAACAPDIGESTAEGAVLAAAQQPIRASALLDRVTYAAWHTKPSWYGVADEDRMLAPAWQRETARRIDARVITLRAGHLPFLSKPNETAAVILAAVDGVRRREWPS